MSVIVYSTPTCPWCKKAKEYLEEKGVEYENVDVSVDQKRAEEAFQKSGQMGVPILEIHGNIIVGFDPVAIDEALL